MREFCLKERLETYDKAREVYGLDAQILMAVEEMSELIKEICKRSRELNSMENVAEEIADVTIMLEQMKYLLDLHDTVDRYMDANV